MWESVRGVCVCFAKVAATTTTSFFFLSSFLFYNNDYLSGRIVLLKS